jgi:tetratricopeptide (TPR) repeat protein
MMPLLKYTSISALIFLLAACTGQQVKSTVDANVESQIIEIPAQAAKDFKVAIELMNQNKFDEALTAFENMTQDYPELSGPFANIGVIYSRQENWEKARDALKISVSKNTHNIKALNQLGLAHRHLGEFKQAEDAYLQAIKAVPNASQSYLNLGILYDIYMGQFVKASNYYQKYQSLQSEPNRQVAGWIVDINRRAGIKSQIAGDTP